MLPFIGFAIAMFMFYSLVPVLLKVCPYLFVYTHKKSNNKYIYGINMSDLFVLRIYVALRRLVVQQC
jgi:hypothetical protein